MKHPEKIKKSTLQCASRLTGLRPYKPASSRWEIQLRLDANEGAACSTMLLEELESIDSQTLRQYPSAASLEQTIALRWDIDPSRVVVCNGGDDAIDRICKSVLESGAKAVLHTPTFEMIRRSIALADGKTCEIEWTDGPFPTNQLIAAIDEQTSLVVLVTPNNPTGGIVHIDEIREIIGAASRVGALVMIDLAYIEFAKVDPTSDLLAYDHVVLVRTFSKAMGLAGLRVGYALASPLVSRWLRTVGGPYPVSSISLQLAQRCWATRSMRETTIDRTIKNRIILENHLRTLGASVFASEANFVFARTVNASRIYRALASLGIAVRAFGQNPQIADCLRITVPDEDRDLSRLLDGLNAAFDPDALLFDIDGVLADVTRSYHTAIIQTSSLFGATIKPAEIAAFKLAGNANNDWLVAQQLIARRGIHIGLDEITSCFQSIYLGSAEVPGLRELETLLIDKAFLAQLADRFKLAAVTGRPRSEAQWFLERFEIQGYFDVLVCMEDAKAKPSPEPVTLALNKLGVKAAWMIGDTPDDICSALGAGVVPIGISNPATKVAPSDETGDPLDQSGAAYVLQTVNQLKDILP